jgi:hypothetical protein
MLLWTYLSTQHREAGAIAPVPLSLPFGRQRAHSPIRTNNYADRWRRIEAGEQVEPSDCRPVRFLAHFGFVVACPGRVVVRQLATPEKGRVLTPDYARFGAIEVSGDLGQKSDSLRIASWIAGSAYAKIQTGILIFYPSAQGLYQGPLPNDALLNVPHNRYVMAGIETNKGKNTVLLEGQEYSVAELNVIISLPEIGHEIAIDKGEPIGWFFPIPNLKEVTLHQLPRPLDKVIDCDRQLDQGP